MGDSKDVHPTTFLKWLHLPEKVDDELVRLVEERCTLETFSGIYSNNPDALGLYDRKYVRAVLIESSARLDILRYLLQVNYERTHDLSAFYDVLRVSIEEFDNVSAVTLVLEFFKTNCIPFTSVWRYGITFVNSPLCFEAFANSSLAPLHNDALMRYVAANPRHNIRRTSKMCPHVFEDAAD